MRSVLLWLAIGMLGAAAPAAAAEITFYNCDDSAHTLEAYNTDDPTCVRPVESMRIPPCASYEIGCGTPGGCKFLGLPPNPAPGCLTAPNLSGPSPYVIVNNNKTGGAIYMALPNFNAAFRQPGIPNDFCVCVEGDIPK